MDLILAKKDVALSATTEWKSKWTPALLQLSETLTGKQGALLKQSQRICHGTYSCVYSGCVLEL